MEKLACSGISKNKVANLNIPVFFRKRYPHPSSPHPPSIFSGTNQLQKNPQRACAAKVFTELPWKEFIVHCDFSLQRDNLFLRLLMFSYHQLMIVTFSCNHSFQFMLMDIIKLTGCPLTLTHILQEYSF